MQPPHTAGTPIRVLLADDDRAVRSALTDLLNSDDGIDVVSVVDDGQQALSAAADCDPDVVIVDLHMPHGGPELVQSLRRAHPAAAVICFSADATGRDMMEQAGVFAFALKGDPDVDLLDLVTAAGTR